MVKLTSIIKDSISKTKLSITDSITYLEKQDDLSLCGIGVVAEIVASPFIIAGHIAVESYKTLAEQYNSQ